SLGSCRRGGYYFGRRVTVKTGCGERGERGKCEEAASLAAGPTNPKRKRGADFHLAYASGWWGLVRILLVTNLEPQHEALRPVIGLLEQHAGEVLSGRRGAGDGEVRNLRHVEVAVDLVAGTHDARPVQDVVAGVEAHRVGQLVAEGDAQLGHDAELRLVEAADVARQRQQAAVEVARVPRGVGDRLAAVDVDPLV